MKSKIEIRFKSTKSFGEFSMISQKVSINDVIFVFFLAYSDYFV